MATIEVKWQGRRFNVEFDDSELETATVHDLKDKCQKITNIEPSRMKLLAYGGKYYITTLKWIFNMLTLGYYYYYDYSRYEE